MKMIYKTLKPHINLKIAHRQNTQCWELRRLIAVILKMECFLLDVLQDFSCSTGSFCFIIPQIFSIGDKLGLQPSLAFFYYGAMLEKDVVYLAANFIYCSTLMDPSQMYRLPMMSCTLMSPPYHRRSWLLNFALITSQSLCA